jgi:hypothetical protein
LLKGIGDYQLTEKENKLLKDINEASNIIDKEVTNEEEIGLLGFRLSEMGKYSYIFIFTALALTLIIVFGGLFMLLSNKNKDKNKQKKKKN